MTNEQQSKFEELNKFLLEIMSQKTQESNSSKPQVSTGMPFLKSQPGRKNIIMIAIKIMVFKVMEHWAKRLFVEF